MIKKLFGLLFLTFILSSCRNVDFDNYYPADQRPLETFDKDFIGKYYYSDSVWLDRLNAKYYSQLIETRDSVSLFSAELTILEKHALVKVELNDYFKISKVDTAKIRQKHELDKVVVEGKHMVVKGGVNDTILNILTKDKLFLYDNKYYLNIFVPGAKQDSSNNINLASPITHWTICQFEKRKGNEYSFNMTNKEDYNMLVDTTKEWLDIYPIAHLTNNQFKKFVAKGGFHQKYRLIKYAH